MSSGLIILIGFGISAVLMLTVWLASKNTRVKNRIQSNIEKQKADIISTIEEAVNEGQKGAKPQRQASGNGAMPVWGKWFMTLSVVPLIGSFVLAGVQGQGAGIVYKTNFPTKNVCFDGTNIWISPIDSNIITKMRASDGLVLGTYQVGTHAEGLCFDGTNIGVANSGSDSVTKIQVAK
jgi:type II secretory pathway pseudopilin PulG